MIALDLNKKLDTDTFQCEEIIELQRIINISKSEDNRIHEDGIFGKKTKEELKINFNKSDVTLSQLKNIGYDVRSEINPSEVWWLHTVTQIEIYSKRKKAMIWWNNLASLRKTQLCDTSTEIVGHVRRHETLTGSEIEKIYNKIQS